MQDAGEIHLYPGMQARLAIATPEGEGLPYADVGR